MMKKQTYYKTSVRLLIVMTLLPTTLIAGLFIQCKKGTVEDDGKAPSAVADHWKVGEVLFDGTKWTECVVGDIPLVITVPHGGGLRPDDVPDRSCEGATTVTDVYTMELAREIRTVLMEEYDVQPYLVLAHLSRRKVDLNREINEATCGNETMKGAWQSFHSYVDTALTTAIAEHGMTLYIDLHGHGHEIPRLELGYGLNTSQLGYVYSGHNLEALQEASSLANLFANVPNADFRQYILGEQAFGTLMEEEGIRAVPSAQDPHPMAGESYFSGGYNTHRYTGATYPEVFGFQIECHRAVRDAPGRRDAAVKFATAIMQYLEQTIVDR